MRARYCILVVKRCVRYKFGLRVQREKLGSTRAIPVRTAMSLGGIM